MDKYILKEFEKSFFTMFTIISVIISLIFIITISNITAKIQITFWELLKMYLLTLPQVIFISLSVSFFISANSTFAKLSETQEIIALLSLGFKPIKILMPVIKVGAVFAIINLLILFLSIPYSKVAFDNFKNEKKQSAKFNFQSNQISQQFGEWSVFATKEKNSFKDIYLFNTKNHQFITAKKAKLITNDALHFNLSQGQIYDFNKSYIIMFDKMSINNKIPTSKISILDFKNYLKQNKKVFTKYIPFSLIPIALIFFIPLISFFHPRLNKNRYLLYSIGVLVLYIAISFANKSLIVSLLIPFIFFILGGVLYKKKF
ncbi:MAG: LptF/LptG family permease [Epsilonproteobacteria bacterium]|nr:LptF/LptG family permease [Campylobacterota bacterium]